MVNKHAFLFLKDDFPSIEKSCAQMEKAIVYTLYESAIVMARKIGEEIAIEISNKNFLVDEKCESQQTRIEKLKRCNLISEVEESCFQDIRLHGNHAAHSALWEDEELVAYQVHKEIYYLSSWFYRSYKDSNFEIMDYPGIIFEDKGLNEINENNQYLDEFKKDFVTKNLELSIDNFNNDLISFCDNCGSILANGSKYCDECGNFVANLNLENELNFCSNCGVAIVGCDKFCHNCGNQLFLEDNSNNYCQFCGKEIKDGFNYCVECGYKIEDDSGQFKENKLLEENPYKNSSRNLENSYSKRSEILNRQIVDSENKFNLNKFDSKYPKNNYSSNEFLSGFLDFFNSRLFKLLIIVFIILISLWLIKNIWVFFFNIFN